MSDELERTMEDVPMIIDGESDLSTGDYVLVNDSGKPIGILISVEKYEALIDAAEELEDIALVEEALRGNQPNIPWETVKVELKL